jgi:Tol biopolymer transport system component
MQITAADDDLWVYDLERRILSRVTDREENLHPAWMPDSQWLVFAHHGTPAPPPPNLVRRRADGGGTSETLLPAGADLEARLYPDVSPDGREVVFAQYSIEHNFDLHVLDLETRRTRLLLRSPESEVHPRFSPDGRWLAWHAAPRTTDPGQIFVQAAKGDGRRWQVTTEGGVSPVWRRDGRALLFVRQGGIYEVELGTGVELAPGPPRLLFHGDYVNRFDVAPDGQRFLMLRRVPEPGASGPIRLELTIPATNDE